MVLGDPALVIVLARASGSAGGLGAGEGLSSLDLLGLLGGAGALGLGEESLDPGLVDEVEGTSEGGGEEDVEEDAISSQISESMGRGLETYIWGSRKLVGASTMEAAALWTWTWWMLPLASETTATRRRRTS